MRRIRNAKMKIVRVAEIIDKILYRIAIYLLPHLPSQDPTLYSFCQSYVNHYRGENNCDIHTNGELRLLQQVLPTCRVVFDVGANVGNWAALALTINPGITIHCFEPSQATFRRLLERGFPANVICLNFGLGAAAEERTLYVFEAASGLNSLYERHGLENGWGLQTQQHKEIVHLDTLDRYCESAGVNMIDFLKVDVEGHELHVLEGSRRMLQEGRIGIVQFEYGGCNIDARILLKDLFDFFSPLPYVLYKIHPHRLQRVDRYDQRLENFQYQNWVAVHSDRLRIVQTE